MDNKKLIENRQNYIEKVSRELLGPGSEFVITDIEHEIITAPAMSRYSIGVLYPNNTEFKRDNVELDNIDDAEEETDYSSDEIDETIESDDAEKNNQTKHNEAENEYESLDEEIGLALQNKPSSMGLTFLAKGNSNTVNCKVDFATYKPTLVTDCAVHFKPLEDEYSIPVKVSNKVYYDSENKLLKLRQDAKISKKEIFALKNDDDMDDFIIDALFKLASQCEGYIRVPHSVDVNLDFTTSEYIDNNSKLDGTFAKVTAIRKKIRDDVFSITIMLVNDSSSTTNNCLYQSQITICTENNDFVFCDFTNTIDFETLSDEEKSLELQYRNKKNYASGLGVSTNWTVDSYGKGYIKTEYFPQSEVPSMEFSLPEGTDLDKKVLSMKYLSDLCEDNKDSKISLLIEFIDLYREWIDSVSEKVDFLEDKFKNIAIKNINACNESYERMLRGINTLKVNDIAWSAFELANRAMFMQRAHIRLTENMADIDVYDGSLEVQDFLDIDYYNVDNPDSEQYIKDYYSWRPFQLAFILLSVNSIVDDNSEEKDIVDLIWFPTGGGKTEAYLGLTAFTIFHRRLAHPNECGGTSVIMRYTLRLLTAQQFTRASTLICACEYIRRDCEGKKPRYKKYNLGKERISIGLWIGGEHIPNTNKIAKEYLDKLICSNNKYEIEKYEKFQVLKCPWCSTKLNKNPGDKKHKYGYHMSEERGNNGFYMFCTQSDCEFNDILPIQIVDEELYKNPPTLLFATVDKFAMLPWNEKIGAFFGLGNNNRTPELIIQDELHLISGPLGTMTGLYESAIDYLCNSKGIKTKIVASTATIRRASEQCVALYDRSVSQFPSPGIDSDDSFFAKEKVINYENGEYGRLYVGMMPSGKTKATMEVRSIAAMAHIVKNMNVSDQEKDKYWTNTVYFNSLSELGKCRTLAEDDVRNQLKILALRKSQVRRYLSNPDELTSRVSTTMLNETLEKIEKITYSENNQDNKRYASDLLLATNMISVGIDVARLNSMIIVGQPKLTSEYIQASSRIGRSYPGVAFVMYDGTRSRDRSHYEQFKSYHEAFYKNVEPTSVTPFSKPARDRALHAIVITMLRHLNDDIREDKGASRFDSQQYKKQIQEIETFIVDRCKSINMTIDANMDDESNDIISEIERIVNEWESETKNYKDDSYYYGSKFMFNKPNEGEGRLLKSFETDSKDSAYNTMMSMRNVDTEVNGEIVFWE